GEGHFEEPVLTADRHRRLRAMGGERKEPGAAAAAKNQRENGGVHGHRNSKSQARAFAPCASAGRARITGTYTGSDKIPRLCGFDSSRARRSSTMISRHLSTR